MSNSATIVYEADTSGWPPESFLVQLDPPIRRFNPEDGSPVDYEYVIVCTKSTTRYGEAGAGADVFPSTADADFVNDTMQPIARYGYGVVHSILAQMGYTTTN